MTTDHKLKLMKYFTKTLWGEVLPDHLQIKVKKVTRVKVCS